MLATAAAAAAVVLPLLLGGEEASRRTNYFEGRLEAGPGGFEEFTSVSSVWSWPLCAALAKYYLESITSHMLPCDVHIFNFACLITHRRGSFVYYQLNSATGTCRLGNAKASPLNGTSSSSADQETDSMVYWTQKPLGRYNSFAIGTSILCPTVVKSISIISYLIELPRAGKTKLVLWM